MIEAAIAYRILTARDSLSGTDGLDSINTTPLNQGALVLAAGEIFKLDRNSVALADGVTIVAPFAGPGRWILLAAPGGMLISVPNIGTLVLLAPSSPSLVWVESLRCYWRRNPSSTVVPDGITVVAAIGGGRWERMVATTSTSWCSQTAWYIDPLVGLDENPGTIALPLATPAELNRRLSVGPLTANVTVNVVAAATVPSCELSVELAGHTLTLQGAAVTVATGTIDAYTDRAHNAFPAAPVPPIVTDAGILDFTPYEGLRMRITDGASVGAVAWLDLANPAGGGVTTCRTTRFSSTPAAAGLPNVAVPLATSAYVIETMPTIQGLSLIARDTPSLSSIFQPGTFVVRNLYIGSDPLVGGQMDVAVKDPWYFLVDGCRIDCNVNTQSENVFNHKHFTRCKFGGPSPDAQIVFTGGVLLSFCLCKGKQTVLCTSDTMLAQHSMWSEGAAGTAILLAADQNLVCLWVLEDVQIWGTTLQGILMASAGQIRTRDGLSGSNTGVGLRLDGGNTAGTGGQSFYWSAAADLPNLQGGAGIISITGLAAIALTWTNVATYGFHSDRQRGIGTLVNGTATITARNADLRPPMIVKDTPAGAPQGVLTCPAATRAAGNFVVNAADLATGALVASDTSTFAWEIPPFARDVIVAQANQLT